MSQASSAQARTGASARARPGSGALAKATAASRERPRGFPSQLLAIRWTSMMSALLDGDTVRQYRMPAYGPPRKTWEPALPPMRRTLGKRSLAAAARPRSVGFAARLPSV